jgi:hypothetical protein
VLLAAARVGPLAAGRPERAAELGTGDLTKGQPGGTADGVPDAEPLAALPAAALPVAALAGAAGVPARGTTALVAADRVVRAELVDADRRAAALLAFAAARPRDAVQLAALALLICRVDALAGLPVAGLARVAGLAAGVGGGGALAAAGAADLTLAAPDLAGAGYRADIPFDTADAAVDARLVVAAALSVTAVGRAAFAVCRTPLLGVGTALVGGDAVAVRTAALPTIAAGGLAAPRSVRSEPALLAPFVAAGRQPRVAPAAAADAARTARLPLVPRCRFARHRARFAVRADTAQSIGGPARACPVAPAALTAVRPRGPRLAAGALEADQAGAAPSAVAQVPAGAVLLADLAGPLRRGGVVLGRHAGEARQRGERRLNDAPSGRGSR